MSLVWTKDRPKPSAYYWMRWPDSQRFKPFLVRVMTAAGGRPERVRWGIDGKLSEKLDILMERGAEWAGPIEPPVEASETKS